MCMMPEYMCVHVPRACAKLMYIKLLGSLHVYVLYVYTYLYTHVQVCTEFQLATCTTYRHISVTIIHLTEETAYQTQVCFSNGAQTLLLEC